MKQISIKYKLRLVLSLALILILTACYPREFELTWEYPYPALFSVATSSILGARGFMDGGPPSGLPPHIQALEEDSYGRRLFAYAEDLSNHRMIIQKIEGDYAYFYPHYNFITGLPENDFRFPVEEIEVLKESNSWNQAMSDSSNFERVRISRRKARGPISNEKLAETHYRIFPDRGLGSPRNAHNRMIFLREDSYGRSVYFGIRSRYDTGTTIVVLFQPDHSFDPETGTLLITDRNSYQTELRLFMESNGWNTPF